MGPNAELKFQITADGTKAKAEIKNIDSAIKAFAVLKDTSFKLLLIGEGPIETELKKLVQDMSLQDRVLFLPPMTQLDLYRRINRQFC